MSAGSQRAYVRASFSPALPPPDVSGGVFGWMRANLFNGVLSSILTILSVAFIAWITPGLVRWLFIAAV